MQFHNKYLNDVLNLSKINNKDTRTMQELNGYFVYKKYTLKLAHGMSS